MIFRDEGGKFRVKVLVDRVEGDTREVLLECVETIRESPTCGDIPRGTLFDVSCKIGCERLVGWTLEEEKTDG